MSLSALSPNRVSKPHTVADPWHALPVEALLDRFRSSTRGLAAVEARTRLAAHGPNEFQEARRISPARILLRQFQSLLIWILLAAGSISWVLGERVDAISILTIVLLNAIIGFYQEFGAEKSIAALKRMVAPQAKVRRDGKVILLPACEIVPGDLLMLEAGDLIAADARLVSATALQAVESALTGESEAVEKRVGLLESQDVPLGDRFNMVFMGTGVAAGTGQALVVATGMHTELGRIAGSLASAGPEEKTPLQHRLDAFGRVLVWATLGIITMLFLVGWFRGTRPLELFLSAISLAVAAVPEGLPAVVTVALALGVSRMARRRTLVRKLAAVESLGSTTVICTDKTGTLTMGQMTVRALMVDGQIYEVTGEGYAPEGEVRKRGETSRAEATESIQRFATVLLACNNAHLVVDQGTWRVIGDPTEGALLTAAAKAGRSREQVEAEFPKRGELPFDSDRKRGTMIRATPEGGLRAFTHGAPGMLLKCCSFLYTSQGIRPLTESDRAQILAQAAAMARQALRVIGSAWRDLEPTAIHHLTPEKVETDMVFVGLSGMQDPPRAEARAAVAKCLDAGIRVIMITGDHPETAAAIARDLGIAAPADQAVTGPQLDKLDEPALRELVKATSVYARVTAEHKRSIVRAWQASGAVVAMTGDGVNDAPAIQGADIGIAMGKSGTEVTRQAADMIITDDNFATIVAAVEEGRGIYDNIRKTLQYLLAGNVGELLLMTVCALLGMPIPLLPVHLLWINLVTDGFPALCLATDPVDHAVMSRRPRPKTEPIANASFLQSMLLTGILTAGVALGVFLFELRTGTLETARSSAFAVLVFAELLRAFGARSETRPVWNIPLRTNLPLLGVVVISFGLQFLSQGNAWVGHLLKTTPMPLRESLWLVALATIPSLVLEVIKCLRKRSSHR